MKNIYFYLAIFGLLAISSCKQYESPSVMTVSPIKGPAETLITIEGANFEDITSLNFNDGVPADFNPSYGSSNAVLFRVPKDAPIGDNVITIETKGGTVTVDFKVTLDAPELNSFSPTSGEVGGTVTFLGENFFEPIQVLFFDSIAGEILHLSPDSMVVEIPEGVERGFITIEANGGDVSTNVQFFTVTNVMVSNFDGEGIHPNNDDWNFSGFILQSDAGDGIRSANPAPIDNNFLKLSGVDNFGIQFIGKAVSPSPAGFIFPIESDLEGTFLEMDLHNNGRENAFLVFVLNERDGSPNDFTYTQALDKEGWHHISIPLTRFADAQNLQVDPQKISRLSFSLFDINLTSNPIEANIDNVNFVQVN